MGIGVLWLLNKVDELNSLRAAAKSLDISYTKAYNMVTNLEKALNRQILIRQKGGQDRQGAQLTPFAREFLMLYDNFQKECKERTKQPFDAFKDRLQTLLKQSKTTQPQKS